MPLSTLLTWGQRSLAEKGLPAQEAVWLLEWATEEKSLVLAPSQVGIRASEKYRSAIAQRLAGVPLQHITGQMQFRGLTLKSGPGVFSVRPETEHLVDIALALPPARAEGELRVADLCSGSGAIGLALGHERPATQVDLVEIDRRTSSYLKKNAALVETAENSEVNVHVEDAITGLRGKENTYDMVVSNPPYVGVADAPTQKEAQRDPSIALYGGGEDGLVTPRGIVGRAYDLLRPGGHLVMEHGESQGEALVRHAGLVGFIGAHTETDLAGRDRYLVAQKPCEKGKR